MGYTRQTALAEAYICDTKEDLTLLPQSSMGSTCLVISDGIEYICNSKGKWLPRSNKTIPDEIKANYYSKKEIHSKILSVPKVALTDNEILAITLKNL